MRFIEAGRSGKYCKLDMRIGHIIAYPNGQLQFENYASTGKGDEDPVFDLGENSRFITRSGIRKDRDNDLNKSLSVARTQISRSSALQ